MFGAQERTSSSPTSRRHCRAPHTGSIAAPGVPCAAGNLAIRSCGLRQPQTQHVCLHRVALRAERGAELRKWLNGSSRGGVHGDTGSFVHESSRICTNEESANGGEMPRPGQRGKGGAEIRSAGTPAACGCCRASHPQTCLRVRFAAAPRPLRHSQRAPAKPAQMLRIRVHSCRFVDNSGYSASPLGSPREVSHLPASMSSRFLPISVPFVPLRGYSSPSLPAFLSSRFPHSMPLLSRRLVRRSPIGRRRKRCEAGSSFPGFQREG